MEYTRAPDYPIDWEEIARAVKELAEWKCRNCRHPHAPNSGYTLTVHHLDHNTSNNQPSNLIALCQRCHLKLEAKYQKVIKTHLSLEEIYNQGYRFLPGFEVESSYHTYLSNPLSMLNK